MNNIKINFNKINFDRQLKKIIEEKQINLYIMMEEV